MRDYLHDSVAYAPDFVAYDDNHEGWSLMDYDGCILMLFDTKQEALDEVRNLAYPFLEALLESDVCIITFLPSSSVAQKLQRCLSYRMSSL